MRSPDHATKKEMGQNRRPAFGQTETMVEKNPPETEMNQNYIFILFGLQVLLYPALGYIVSRINRVEKKLDDHIRWHLNQKE